MVGSAGGAAGIDGAMPKIAQLADEAAIRTIIERQFASLSWTENAAPGWDDFAGDFLAGAMLYPSIRPPRPITVADFVDRMRGLSQTSLCTFEEEVLGVEIRVFGNIAIAAVGCQVTENRDTSGQSVEMLLLARSEGVWKIVAQAWDKASDANPLPDALVSGAASR